MLKYTFIILFLIIPAQASSIVLLNSTTIQDMQDNINLITLSGAYISHRYPPNILIGDNISINLTNQKNIVLITSSLVNSSDYPNLSYIVLESWNKDIQIKLSPYKLAQSLSVPIEPIYNDVVNMMSQKSIQSNNNPDQSKIYGASFIDTSEYFIGDIAIGIIIPESNGSIDNNTLNWTTEQEINIINKIRNGLNWWISKEPNANITFTYDIHYRVPTSYEPTLRPSFSSLGQELWMTDAMTYLNYTNLSDYYGNIIDYDNYIRNNLSTDWAFTVFVVNGNHFIDNYFAYASLGGPFFVMTYSNNGYSINNMDAVTAHETGHIFYANDQYTSSNTPCSERTGYLNIENQNSEQSCISNVPSIMRGQVSPFTNNQIDTYARQQLGWSDTNNNSVLDILDFPPTTTISPYQNISNNAAPIFNILTTTTSTLPSLNPVS